MAKKIIWSPRAVEDAESICQFIGSDSKHHAYHFARRVMEIVESIPLYPGMGRIVPEYENPDLRERLHGSYRIVYRLKEDAIEIVTITHGARLLRDIGD